jgi:hypothetical protein
MGNGKWEKGKGKWEINPVVNIRRTPYAQYVSKYTFDGDARPDARCLSYNLCPPGSIPNFSELTRGVNTIRSILRT